MCTLELALVTMKSRAPKISVGKQDALEAAFEIQSEPTGWRSRIELHG